MVRYTLVNPIDATILSDGTIVVADFIRGFFRLRYFDAEGHSLAQVGRHGQGPFEFQQGVMFVTALPGDSVIVGNAAYRYSVFGPRGEPVRSGRWRASPGTRPLEFVPAVDAIVLVGIDDHGDPPGRGRVTRGSYEVSLQRPEEAGGTLLGTWPGPTSAITDEGGYVAAPFEAASMWTPVDDHVWVVGADDPSTLIKLSHRGERLLTVALPPGSEVDGDGVDAWRDWALARVRPEARSGYRRVLRRLAIPQRAPALDALMADDGGHLWAMEFDVPWSEEDYHWQVRDSQGRLVARAVIPFDVLGPRARDPLRSNMAALFPIKAVVDGRVLVLRIDDYGVARMFLHPIVRVEG